MNFYEFLEDNMFPILMLSIIASFFILFAVIVSATSYEEKTPYQECVMKVVTYNRDAKELDILMSYCRDLK